MDLFLDASNHPHEKIKIRNAEASLQPLELFPFRPNSILAERHARIHADLPPSGIYVFEKSIAAAQGIILTTDRKIVLAPDLIISQYFKDRVQEAVSGRDRENAIFRAISGECTVHDYDGDLVHVSKAGWQVYGHWLLDILPAIWLYKRYNAQGFLSKNARVLLPQGTPAWALNMAREATGLTDSECLFYNETTDVFRPSRLIVPSSLRIDNVFSPLLNEMVNELVEKSAQQSNVVTPKRLFIYRGDQKSFMARALPQEAEFAAIARSLGYTIFNPASVGWLDQIRIFSEAELVLGAFGSGMHNTIFGGTSTKSMILTNSHMNWIQSGLSALRSQTMAYINSSREIDGSPREIYYDLNEYKMLLESITSSDAGNYVMSDDVIDKVADQNVESQVDQNVEVQFETEHLGQHYHAFMGKLSKLRGTRRYLEVGVQGGHHLSGITATRAVGVDPQFLISANIALNKDEVVLVQATSDAFFEKEKTSSCLGGPPDFVFLDGMHVFEFLLRDFYNSEQLCHKGSLIALHDCLPLHAGMMKRSIVEAAGATGGTKHYGAWTGDVWKIIPILKKYRPDLKVVCVDCAPTGLVFITNLDPSSRVLADNYMNIVEDFIKVGNDEQDLKDLYASITMVNADKILNEFDHSLYFTI